MTKIIDLPTTASTDANTYVPVYKDGKTQKVSATVFGGGGSGLDLTSTTDVPAVEGTEYLPLNKPLGSVFRVTVQRILDWILARANTWTGNQTFNANVNFTGTGRRITGDFSNATVANRMMFQSNVANSNTGVIAIPNGTASIAGFRATNNSDPTNASILDMIVFSNSEARITSGAHGSGALLPLSVHVGGAERLRITPDGNVLVTGVLGYGSGGTVTQATSKTTQVTLNKSCGKIITHAQSLAPGQSILFDSLNTFANECVCMANIDSSTPEYWNYKADAVAVANGRITFRLTNMAPVSLASNVVIKFALLNIATT